MTDPQDRLLNPERKPDDRADYALRPKLLKDLIGQERVKENLQILVDAAKKRKQPLDHVLFYGPPGLGKCITADSLILTARGWVPFSDLIPANLEKDASIPAEITVYGVNGLEHTSHIYASGWGETRRVVTRSGFVIEGTPHHPLLVATENGPQWKRLDQLSPNDFVAIARGMDVWGTAQTQTWHADSPHDRKSQSEKAILQVHSELSHALSRPPSGIELRHAYARETSRNPTPEYTAKRLGLPLTNGRQIQSIAEPWTFVDAFAAPTGRTIRLDADLAYFMGVLVGDGHFEKGHNYPRFIITCDEEALQQELQRITEKHFGFVPKIRKYGEKAARLDFSQTIGEVMLKFGAKAVTAFDKAVPAAILTSPRDVVIGFLQGLFDADGSAWPDGYVEFGTRSETLSKHVQLLLANLGIIAHRTEKIVKGTSFWYLFLGGLDASKFHEIVSFRLERKRIRGDALTTRKRGWNRSDLVPFANPFLKHLLMLAAPHPRAVHKTFDHVKRNDRIPTRTQIQKYLSLLPEWVQQTSEYVVLSTLIAPNIYWDQVAGITSSQAETYDFVVPDTHSFVANGFYNHNTTLAHVMANEMGVNIKITAGPVIERQGDLAALLTNLREGDILFIDEIHRLGRAVEEVLYPAMEDFALDIVIGKGPSARSIRLKLPRFTVIGATTRLALVTAPLRARFGAVYRLDYYEPEAMKQIVERAAKMLTVPANPDGIAEIARRARGTPRVALRLLRRVRDFAEVRAEGHINLEVAAQALDLLNVDRLGLDDIDRQVLQTIIEKYRGGPVGLGTIAASVSEERDTIEDVVEPYLLQLGFLERTSQGRLATRLAYEHLGLEAPKDGQARLL